MEKRTIIFYWLLILIPAIIISIAAFQLIYHEQERINSLAVAAMEDRARAIGETLQITVENVEDELTWSLLNIPEDELETTLLDWERKNPLIRNVFIWDENSGLKYPEAGNASTSEEKQFISRFEGLFSGRISWPSGKTETNNDEPEKKSPDILTGITKLNVAKKELLRIVQSEYRSADHSEKSHAGDSTDGGWMPWFSENRLHILGWVNKSGNGRFYGVELELMTLLSRLINNFPDISDGEAGYALVDDEGRLLHQTGDIIIDSQTRPLLTVSLAPHLPHWSIAVYMQASQGPVIAGNNFMIPACLLLIIFLAAIAAGGLLLMRHAKQNMIDAQQKTSFVSNVSHELKTPLTSIRMFAELLSEGRAEDPDKKNRYLQIIVSESRRLTRLVNNVLDFSRLEQGRKRYHFEDIDIGVLLREIMEFHNPRIRDSGMEARLIVPDKNIIIKTDRDALEQAILNLIDNAIKYAASGGEIAVSIHTDTEYIEIRIQDRGPGIPETHRKKIFEKFHRVDDTLTTRTQGSGLGLSIARRMLRDMGGDLNYESRPDGGSCFIAKVPIDSVH